MKPNREQILTHLNFLFKDTPSEYEDGMIEIAYTGVNTKSLGQAHYFGVDEIEDAADFATEKNSQAGINIYVGAALRAPDHAPFGRSSLEDYYVSQCAWVDIDDKEPAEQAKDNYKALPPSMVVVTGRHPHIRFQAWWKLAEPEQDNEKLKESLSGLKHAMDGDPAVVDAARVMRVGGSVAWPKKDGRVPELTEVAVPADKTDKASIERIMDVYEPVAIATASGERITSDGKPRAMFKGNLKIEKLLEATKEQGKWHYNMRDAVAAMIGRGWNDQQIRLACSSYCDDGANDPDLTPLINKARTKWDVPNIEPEINLNTGEIITQEKDVRVLPLMFADDIQPVTDVRDFVEGLLCEKEFSVVYGESNCGKTFFMLDLAMHVALGREWRGCEVEQGGVVYAALEGGHGTKNRIVAFKRHHMIMENIPLAVIPSGVNFLDTEGDIQSLLNAIEAAKERIGDIKLIVIDTLARAISGGDENSSMDMGQIVINADLIRERTNAHICFIHHSGKDAAKGSRGHSGLRAAVDTEVEISRDDPNSPSMIKVVKQREMEMMEDMCFSLQKVELGENRRGKEVSSCVAIPVEYTPQVKTAKLSDIQQFVYEALVDCVLEHGKMRTVYKDERPVNSVTYDELRGTLEERGYKEVLATKSKSTSQQIKSATQAARVALKKHEKANFNGNYVWVMGENE